GSTPRWPRRARPAAARPPASATRSAASRRRSPTCAAACAPRATRPRSCRAPTPSRSSTTRSAARPSSSRRRAPTSAPCRSCSEPDVSRAALALLCALAACQGRSRTRNSAGGELGEAAAGPKAGNIYRFVTVEQSLADACKALQAERWADARGATQALLKEQPGHVEARRIEQQAATELASQPHFEAFTRALALHDNGAIGGHFRGIPEP